MLRVAVAAAASLLATVSRVWLEWRVCESSAWPGLNIIAIVVGVAGLAADSDFDSSSSSEEAADTDTDTDSSSRYAQGEGGSCRYQRCIYLGIRASIRAGAS